MTTLFDLPEELLLMVLENLPRWQICRIKTVCQAMYRLAHLVLLRLVTVKSPDAINAFLAFIDRQTDPSYIRAVKKSNTATLIMVMFVLTRISLNDFSFAFPISRTSLWEGSLLWQKDLQMNSARLFWKIALNSTLLRHISFVIHRHLIATLFTKFDCYRLN